MNPAATKPDVTRFARIPLELTELRRWVLWKYEPRGDSGEMTKVPYQPSGAKAKADDPSTWSDYATVLTAYGDRPDEFAGIGFELGDGYCGVDLDQALDESGEMKEWARPFAKAIPSFGDISPSLRGVKYICKGSLPTNTSGIRRRRPGGAPKEAVELYQKERFFTLTGAVWNDQIRILNCADALHRIFTEVDAWNKKSKEPPQAKPRANGTPDDQKIIDKILAGKDSAKWKRLWHGDTGDYGGDESSADLALCGRIAFFTGPEPARIASIFGQSGLTRDKWNDRADYRERTIAKALEGKTEFYKWNGNGARNVSSKGKHSTETAVKPNYPDPIPLSDPDPPAWPNGIYTGWMGTFSEAVTAATETPPELAGTIGLATLAMLAQGKISVRPEPGYFEQLSIYAAAFLPSGQRKTAVLHSFLKPIVQYERSKAAELGPQIKRLAAERKTKELQIRKAREKAATSGDENAIKSVAEMEASLPDVPVIPRLFVQDVTPEHLGTLMAQHGERMAILSDEGGVFETFSGKYNNNIPNLDLLLQAYTGTFHRVDRGCREPVILNHPALTIAVTPQPEVAAGMAAKPGFRGRGLLARFIYVIPPSNLGTRKLEPKPIPDDVARVYEEYINTLITLPTPEESNRDGPVVLTFSPEAYGIWKEFQRRVESMMTNGGKLEVFTDLGGKLPGTCARIAGLLHLADYPAAAMTSREIDAGVMTRAVTLAEFYLGHVMTVFGVMGADRDMLAARRLWAVIERMGAMSVAAREAWNPLRGTYPRMDDVAGGFRVLVERAYLLESDEDDQRGPGRPSRRYTVNPKAATGFAHSAHSSQVVT